MYALLPTMPIQQAKTNGNDVVIVDTAGRLAIDEQMMNEISNLKNHLAS